MKKCNACGRDVPTGDYHPNLRGGLCTRCAKMLGPLRTWTAKIEVRTSRGVLALDAADSPLDLLRDQTNVAVREAEQYVSDVSTVEVVIYKFTIARGRRRDRSFSVFRDRRGQVRYQ
jgi:hypothetical protein